MARLRPITVVAAETVETAKPDRRVEPLALALGAPEARAVTAPEEVAAAVEPVATPFPSRSSETRLASPARSLPPEREETAATAVCLVRVRAPQVAQVVRAQRARRKRRLGSDCVEGRNRCAAVSPVGEGGSRPRGGGAPGGHLGLEARGRIDATVSVARPHARPQKALVCRRATRPRKLRRGQGGERAEIGSSQTPSPAHREDYVRTIVDARSTSS